MGVIPPLCTSGVELGVQWTGKPLSAFDTSHLAHVTVNIGSISGRPAAETPFSAFSFSTSEWEARSCY